MESWCKLLKTLRTAGFLSMWVFGCLASLLELTVEKLELNFAQLLHLKDDFKKAALIFRVVYLYMLYYTKLLNHPLSFGLVSCYMRPPCGTKNRSSMPPLPKRISRGQVSECHTLVPWASTAEGVLHHFVYNKSITTRPLKPLSIAASSDDLAVVKCQGLWGRLANAPSFILSPHTLSLYLRSSNPFESTALSSLSHLECSFNYASTHQFICAELVKIVCDNITSCPEWCKLLKDILGWDLVKKPITFWPHHQSGGATLDF